MSPIVDYENRILFIFVIAGMQETTCDRFLGDQRAYELVAPKVARVSRHQDKARGERVVCSKVCIRFSVRPSPEAVEAKAGEVEHHYRDTSSHNHVLRSEERRVGKEC